MDAISEYFSGNIVLRNMATLAAVLLLFGLAYILNDRYNKGHSKAFLYAARASIVLSALLLIIWFF